MASASAWTSVVFALCVSVRVTAALEFYPYGPAYDSQLSKQNDVSSLEIPLAVSIKFYGETYNSIFVNSNGLLSFLTEIPMFFSIQFPLNYPIIAPLYANVDTSERGQVYYRETQDPELLQRINNRIANHYPNLPQPFTAHSIFVATWVEVGYFPRGTDKVNTFQVVVASDGTETFAELLYRQGGIQWVQGQGANSRLPDARAQAGFVAEDGRLYTLRGSGTDQIQNLDRWSNTDEPGDWLFRIGNTGPTGNVEPPQINFKDTENLVEDVSCRTGATVCHSRAECQDQEQGFCCICQQGYYGNGRTCLPDNIPLRVNGKVQLSISGAPPQEVDVQAYVVTADGRCYTALSRVPPAIGNNAQLITTTGDIIGWLFAKSINNAPNGYMLTGGSFNHSAVLSFADGQHRVEVQQQFLGLDVFDQLRMEGKISGSLPQVPPGLKLTLPDTQLQFRKHSKGVIRSQSSHVVYVEGSVEQYPVSVEQTITFNDYCPSSSETEATFRLKAARNFISYEEREDILRFAATNKISSLSDNDDPCVVGQVSCVNNSYCIPEGSTFRCVCKTGFQTLYSDEGTGDYGCVDINECQSGPHNCDQNALCINEVGSYSCQCRPGYSGNGYTCQEVIEVADCSTISCTPGAECINAEDGPRCVCIPGFIGDGTVCTPNAEDDCLICSPHAWCNGTDSGQVECTCLPGYQGNGRECTQADGTQVPTCLLGECWCASDYTLHGELCISDSVAVANAQTPIQPVPDSRDVSCNIMNNCHPQAQCIYLHSQGAYECQCNAGYEGDGYDCSEVELSCTEADICHLYASCVEGEGTERAICVCDEGYQGDGMNCQKSDICTDDVECGENAVCMWSEDTMRKECECNPGYVLDYNKCIRQEVCDECHAGADCVMGPAGISQCVCRSGMVGNGIDSCEPQPTGCNLLNNCAREAECVFVSSDVGYHCQCKQGFEGNGLECNQVNNCLTNQSLCSENADCTASTSDFGYECKCKPGYYGDGFTCKEVHQTEGGFLLVNKGMATVRIPMEPTKSNPGRPIQLQYDQIAIGLAVDCGRNMVYWSDIAGQVIKTSSLNGKDIEVFNNKDVSSPEGLAVDWIARKLYWTDSEKDVIMASNLETKEVETIISTALINPRGIAVHPTRRKVYWSDWNRSAPKLESANLDGSGREVLVSRDVQLPNSLAIDWATNELCWTDAGTKKIECLNLDSLARRTVVSNSNYPFGLAITDEKYYWTDWQSQKVESAFKFSSAVSNPLNVPLGGSGKLYGIVAVSDSCPRL